MGRYRAIVMGASAGGIEAYRYLFSTLPADLPVPVFAVLHVHPDTYSINSLFNQCCIIPVTEAEDGEKPKPGRIYLAPPGYHMLLEEDETISLFVFEKVVHCRPAIDPLFISAANLYREGLIGMVLTGANEDGSAGLVAIKAMGGHVIVQEPLDAEIFTMPKAAIDAVPDANKVKLADAGALLSALCRQ